MRSELSFGHKVKEVFKSSLRRLRDLTYHSFRFGGGHKKLLGAGAAILCMVGLLVSDLLTNEIVLEPIEVAPNVPGSITSAAITEDFYSQYQNLRRHTFTAFNAEVALVDPSALADIKVKAGPVDTTILGLLDAIRAVLRKPRPTIKGVLSTTEPPGRLLLRIFPPNHASIECTIQSGLASDLADCTESLSEILEPYTTAAYYFQHRQWNRAQKLIYKLISSNRSENLAWGHNLLGQLEAKEQRPDTAMQEYQKALQVSRCFAPAYVNMGNLSFSRNDKSKAEQFYEKALNCSSDTMLARVNLGELRESQGQYAAAAALYQQALRIDPTYALAYSGLGELAARRNDIANAEIYFGQAEIFSESKSAPYIAWGDVYFKEGNYLASAIRYRQAVGADQADGVAWEKLAAAEFLSGDHESAKTDIAKCVPALLAPKITEHPVDDKTLNALLAMDAVLRPYDAHDDLTCVKEYRLINQSK